MKNQKRANKTTKDRGRGLRPPRRASAVIHSEPEKNSALSATNAKAIEQAAQAVLDAGHTLTLKAKHFESAKKRSEPGFQKEINERAALREKAREQAEELHHLRKTQGMAMEARAARIAEIETPSKRRALASARVDREQAEDRQRFAKLAPDSFVWDEMRADIQRQAATKPELVSNVMKILERELHWLREFDGMDRKALAKRITKVQTMQDEVTGKLRGAPPVYGSIAARQEYAEDLADEIANELANEWKSAAKRKALTAEQLAGQCDDVRTYLYPLGEALREWADFQKLLAAVRAMGRMVEKSQPKRIQKALETIIRDWPELTDIVNADAKKLSWDNGRMVVAKKALVKFLWRLPDYFSREAMDERDRVNDEMERVAALLVQEKKGPEIATAIERETIIRREVRIAVADQKKRGISEKDIMENIEAMLSSDAFKLDVKRDLISPKLTEFAIRDRHRSYCEKHGIEKLCARCNKRPCVCRKAMKRAPKV